MEHSYSLSKVEKIDYNESDPTSFHIVFPTFTTVLQAETGKEAKDWVEKIKSGENDKQCCINLLLLFLTTINIIKHIHGIQRQLHKV